MSTTEERRELWGGETTKAVANFPVSGNQIPVPVIRWLGRIKATAARVNADLGLLDQECRGSAGDSRLGRERSQNTLPQVAPTPLPGTATGTGLNPHPE